MEFKIEKVVASDQMAMFVMLPYNLYDGDEKWVPPMIDDEFDMMDPECNPAWAFCDVEMWIARDEAGECIGRVAAIVNHKWIAKSGLKCGRMSRFDCIDNQDVATALLTVAEEYLRKAGMDTVHGPMGFNNLDHQGVLIEGFDHLPSIGSEYSKPYYYRLIEASGYVKQKDWVEFRLTMPKKVPEKSARVEKIVRERTGIRCRSFKTKSELREYAPRIFELFNEAFAELFGTYKFDAQLITFYIDKYMPVLLPRYVKVAEYEDGRMAGFVIALPSLSEALIKAKGRLLPFGWWHVMRAFRRPKVIDLLLTGVRPELQRLGVSSMLMNELWKTATKDGVEYVETTGMLEDNKVAIQMWKTFEYIQHKRKRCYVKSLT